MAGLKGFEIRTPPVRSFGAVPLRFESWLVGSSLIKRGMYMFIIYSFIKIFGYILCIILCLPSCLMLKFDGDFLGKLAFCVKLDI